MSFPVSLLRTWPSLAGSFPLAAAVAALALPGLAASQAVAAQPPAVAAALATSAGPWVEESFPFFSSVVDLRKTGNGSPANNLAPRSLVLNLGQKTWVAFDHDLLRVAAVWEGEGLAPRALAPGSYLDPRRKGPAGQNNLPIIVGTLWASTGIYPGWQVGAQPSFVDPRTPAPSPEEVGRGGLPEALGRFDAVRLVADGARLEFTVGRTRVREQWSSAGAAEALAIERTVDVEAGAEPLVLVLGQLAADHTLTLRLPEETSTARPELAAQEGTWYVRIPARTAPAAFTVRYARGGTLPGTDTGAIRPRDERKPAARWAQAIETGVELSTAGDAYVIDHVALPSENPWRRKVRPCDVQFLPDGTGVVVTIDGDLWLAKGLAAASGPVRWTRFSSGLHEPMSVAIRDGEIFAFDKNGIWRIRDTDGNGEADVHELFSNVFGQTADGREFPSTIRLSPGGEFVIAKGGQQAVTLGKHNGSVLRISADGRNVTVLGYGLRQPNIAVHPRTGLVTSSDQQGHYIPSTPLHIVRDGQFYGFLGDFQPKEVYPAEIAEPLTWIPHPANPSALSQIWLVDAKMGPLNEEMIHIGFNRPEIFRVIQNGRGQRPQAAVVSLTRAFKFPPLNGSVNPVDGQVYLAGFQVIGWGNVMDAPGGLGRLRYTGAPLTLPREIVPTKTGVLLRFEVPLDPEKATDAANFMVQSWGYRRTPNYGSPLFKADGTTGRDELVVSQAYLSADGRSVFAAIPGMTPVMQLRVSWDLATADGSRMAEDAYTTPYDLVDFDPLAEGFGDITINLTPRVVAASAAGAISAQRGREIAQTLACIACHVVDRPTPSGAAGPSWSGLYGRERSVYVAGAPGPVLADEAYLRESILEPTRKLAAGFQSGEQAMPSYAGILSEEELKSVIEYIKSLR